MSFQIYFVDPLKMNNTKVSVVNSEEFMNTRVEELLKTTVSQTLQTSVSSRFIFAVFSLLGQKREAK